MKKLIALSATALTLVFAFALANASNYKDQTNQEPGTMPSEQAGMMDESQMPGQVPGTMPSEQPGMADESQAMPQTDTGSMGSTGDLDTSKSKKQASREKQLRASKYCTDKDGLTFRKGQEGFERCIQSKMEQMGGQAATERSTPSGTEQGSLSQEPSATASHRADMDMSRSEQSRDSRGANNYPNDTTSGSESSSG